MVPRAAPVVGCQAWSRVCRELQVSMVGVLGGCRTCRHAEDVFGGIVSTGSRRNAITTSCEAVRRLESRRAGSWKTGGCQ